MKQTDNQSCSNLIGEMNYRFTEQDCITSMQNLKKINEMDGKLKSDKPVKSINSKGKVKQNSKPDKKYVSICLLIFIIALYAVMFVTERRISDLFWFVGCLFAAALPIFVLTSLSRYKGKKDIVKQVEIMREAGELDRIFKISLYEDRIESMSNMHFNLRSIDEIVKVCEMEDGLYIFYVDAPFTYIPARCFDGDSHERVTSFFFHNMGIYECFSKMNLSDAAEYTEEPVSPLAEQSDPGFEISYVNDENVIAVISEKEFNKFVFRRIIETLIFAAITILCFVVKLSNEFIDHAIRLVGISFSVLTLLFAVYTVRMPELRRLQPRQSLPKNIRQKYFSDHMTQIVGQNVMKINYTKIKSINIMSTKRFGKLILILLKNNNFIYVPESAAQSAEQFAEFRKFISGFAQEKKN